MTMTRATTAPIAPVSVFIPARTHIPVIPMTGAIGANRRSERCSSADAYRRGICVDCQTVPYSAGRPRCTDCHNGYLSRHTFDPQAVPNQPCADPRCNRITITQPGHVLCAGGPKKRKTTP